MSVYNHSGTQLTKLYGHSGTSLDVAYDSSGNIIFQLANDIIHSPPIPSWYLKNANDVASEINRLDKSWETFIFITDVHAAENAQNSQQIALEFMKNTKASRIIFGGDFSIGDWNKQEYKTYVTPFLQSDFMHQIYSCYGNHEYYGDKNESSQTLYEDFVSDKNVIGNPQKHYYYFDDSSKKTRYMFLNTSEATSESMSQTQVSWIAQNVILPAIDWYLVVFGHINLKKIGGVTTMNLGNGQAVIDALSLCNGKIVGYFCGHQHIDGIGYIGKFVQASLICDMLDATNWYSGLSFTDRVRGTVTEQGFSVISFNRSKRKVEIRRIGAGKKLFYSYDF